MAGPHNRELVARLRTLFEQEKLKSKDDLLTLFTRHLGFEYAAAPWPSRSVECWGEGQVASLVAAESFEILAKVGAPQQGFAVVYGTLHDFNLSNQPRSFCARVSPGHRGIQPGAGRRS